MKRIDMTYSIKRNKRLDKQFLFKKRGLGINKSSTKLLVESVIMLCSGLTLAFYLNTIPKRIEIDDFIIETLNKFTASFLSLFESLISIILLFLIISLIAISLILILGGILRLSRLLIYILRMKSKNKRKNLRFRK